MANSGRVVIDPDDDMQLRDILRDANKVTTPDNVYLLRNRLKEKAKSDYYFELAEELDVTKDGYKLSFPNLSSAREYVENVLLERDDPDEPYCFEDKLIDSPSRVSRNTPPEE